MKRRLLSCLLTLCMVFTLFPSLTTHAQAAKYADTAGHWAESAIDRWSDRGVVNGSGGRFRPDASMTRAEAASLFSKLFALTDDSAKTAFPDLKPESWYYSAMNRAINAGIINGMNGAANPDGVLTREMFFVMFARGLGLKPQDTTRGLAADGGEWSKGYINTLTDRGYVRGMNGAVNATADINRASVVSLLDQTVEAYANTPGETVAGTGKGVVLVAAPNVTVTGKTDDLFVAPGAAGGTLTLRDADVAGRAVVNAPSAVAMTGSSSVAALELTDRAKGANVTVGDDSAIDALTSDAADAAISGSGKVGKATVNAPANRVDTVGTALTVAPSASGTTSNGKTVPAKTTVITQPRTAVGGGGRTNSGGSKTTGLTNLKLIDSAHLVDFTFDPAVTEYNVEVFEDAYGVQFIPTVVGGSATFTFSGESHITSVSKIGTEEGATAEALFTNAYNVDELPDPIEVQSGEIIALGMDENREANISGNAPRRGMEDDCDYDVTITAGEKSYIIHIHRPGAYKLVEKFVKRSGDAPAEARAYSDYTLYQPLAGETANGNPRYMPYCLYLPEGYTADKEYPVLIVPHGAGQFQNGSDDLILRTAQATSFVHYGQEVILIVPQGNDQTIAHKSTSWHANANEENPLKLSEFGEATMQVLFDLEKEDNPYGIKVDKSRVYVAGGSMGGAGASAFLATYPDVFAAGVIVCPFGLNDTNRANYLAKQVSDYNIAVTLVHSKGDGGAGGVAFATSQAIQKAFDDLGYTNYQTAFYEADHYGSLTGKDAKGPYDADDFYLWPTAHFSWVPFFADKDNQDWLLSQVKSAQLPK